MDSGDLTLASPYSVAECIERLQAAIPPDRFLRFRSGLALRTRGTKLRLRRIPPVYERSSATCLHIELTGTQSETLVQTRWELGWGPRGVLAIWTVGAFGIPTIMLGVTWVTRQAAALALALVILFAALAVVAFARWWLFGWSRREADAMVSVVRSVLDAHEITLVTPATARRFAVVERFTPELVAAAVVLSAAWVYFLAGSPDDSRAPPPIPDHAEPPLSTQQLEAVVELGRPALAACHAEHGEGLARDFKITLEIGVDGEITLENVDSDAPVELSTCVQNAIAQWTFPPGHFTVTSFPLHFAGH